MIQEYMDYGIVALTLMLDHIEYEVYYHIMEEIINFLIH